MSSKTDKYDSFSKEKCCMTHFLKNSLEEKKLLSCALTLCILKIRKFSVGFYFRETSQLKLKLFFYS